MKTVRTSELIDILRGIYMERGDLPVFVPVSVQPIASADVWRTEMRAISNVQVIAPTGFPDDDFVSLETSA